MTKKEFLNLFEEIIEADPGSLKGSETLVDIRKWDSLAVVGLIAMVDENFGLTLSAKAIRDSKTVADLIGLLGDRILQEPAGT